MKRFFSSLLITGTLVALPGAAAAAQTSLNPVEQNNIQVFKAASKAVVHIQARVDLDSKFEMQEVGSSAGSGFVIDKRRSHARPGQSPAPAWSTAPTSAAHHSGPGLS